MKILWIMVPAPFVGYLLVNSVRKIFSDDDKLLRKLFEFQPVTMIAGTTALGSIIVWSLVAALRLW